MLGWHRENAHAHSQLEPKRNARSGRVVSGMTLGVQPDRAQPELLPRPEGPGASLGSKSRLDRYRHSGDLIQKMLNHLYGSLEAYVRAGEPHPLEAAVWAYNEVMGIDGLVRAVAERYGFVLDPEEDADLGFISAILASES